MAFDILETHELAGVIRTFPPMSSYWLDLCFPNVHFSNTEYIDFDIVDKARRLAPFVAPNVQGQPMLARRETIRKFKPAYLKPKEALDPQRGQSIQFLTGARLASGVGHVKDGNSRNARAAGLMPAGHPVCAACRALGGRGQSGMDHGDRGCGFPDFRRCSPEFGCAALHFEMVPE